MLAGTLLRKSRGRLRCAQAPSSNTSHRTYSEPLQVNVIIQYISMYSDKSLSIDMCYIVECIVEVFLPSGR